jgi:hypothetical protein
VGAATSSSLLTESNAASELEFVGVTIKDGVGIESLEGACELVWALVEGAGVTFGICQGQGFKRT